MRLKKLISVLKINNKPSHISDMSISSICHDSRRADGESIFLCKCGAKVDGHDFAPKAYAQGARVFVAQKPLSLPDDAQVFYVPDTGDALSALAQKFYGYPQKKLKLIGVTGTKGKTTLALSVYDIANKCGKRTGYIGTNGVYFGDVYEPTANTTPDVLEIQRILREMVRAGVKYAVLEISSQALWQKRIDGLEFDMTLFTNLYPDHIGGVEHPTFEHYRDAKRSLFTDYKTDKIIVNSDSEYARYMTEGVRRRVYSTSATLRADIYAENIRNARRGDSLGTAFECFGRGFSGEEIFIPFPGVYSVENALQTMSVCLGMGIKKPEIISAMEQLVVGGRFELIRLSCKPGVLFIIDYAHNGAGLCAVLEALRAYGPARIITLFGSVGGRTYERRAGLAEAASAGSDIIVLTSDNPDREDPMAVIDDIASYMVECDKPIYKIPDRAEAIGFAAEMAQEGDFVLLAGKGHETYQLIGGISVPFSEKDILLEIDKESARRSAPYKMT